MTRFHEYLGPSRRWLPLVEQGVVYVNRGANRLCWTEGGRFAAKLTPSAGLGVRLASLPASVEAVQKLIATTQELTQIAPALEALQLVSTVGAIASVAGVGVSIAGFAAVLHRLKRIEGKLDEMIMKLDGLRAAVRSLGASTESFLMARLSSASENLDRCIAADTKDEQVHLARDARRLFQESRLRYLELWRQTDPWSNPDIEVVTALELQGRYVASAIGELQAEFLLGDRGAFVHATMSAARDVAETMRLDPPKVFRLRSDASLSTVATKGYRPAHQATVLAAMLPVLRDQLRLAAAVTTESASRLTAFEDDADLPGLVGGSAHEILRAVRDAPGVDVFAVGLTLEAA